jgi:D-glycero-alpha-D-manno-heptose-7-phosphate kinase
MTIKRFVVVECTPSQARSSLELRDATGAVYAAPSRDTASLVSEPGIGGLVGRALAFFGESAHVSIRVDAPLGSGLGTSGAITVAMTRALLDLSGNHMVHAESIPHLAAALERVAGHAGGLQDQLASATGGFGAYRFDRGKISKIRLAAIPPFLRGAVLAFPPPAQRRIGSGSLVSLVTDSWREGTRATIRAMRNLARTSNELYRVLAEPNADHDAARRVVEEIIHAQRSLHSQICQGIDETPIWPYIQRHQVIGKPLGGAGRGAAWLLLRPLPRGLASSLAEHGWTTVPLAIEHARAPIGVDQRSPGQLSSVPLSQATDEVTAAVLQQAHERRGHDGIAQNGHAQWTKRHTRGGVGQRR